MAEGKGGGGLFKKYGKSLDQAARKHGNDPTEWGQQRPPAGIVNGIAQVVKCGFGQVAAGKQNAGEWYFRAEAVIVEPTEVPGPGNSMLPCAGLRTSVMEMVCATTTKSGPNAGRVTSVEEHVASILNTMRKLGADTTDATGAELESIAAAIAEARPYIRFSTRARKAQPGSGGEDGIWEDWHGVKGLENYAGPDAAEGAVEADEPDAGGPADADSFDSAADAEPEEDLDALVEAAAEDDAAQQRLSDIALAAGVPQKRIDGAADWAEVGALIADARDKAEAAETEEPAGPAKGDTVVYAPPDPKNPKKAGKAVECEITAIDAKTGALTLKDLTNPKLIYKAVPAAKVKPAG